MVFLHTLASAAGPLDNKTKDEAERKPNLASLTNYCKKKSCRLQSGGFDGGCMFQAVGFKLVFMFSLISSGTFSPTAHIYADLNCPVGVCVYVGGGG